MPTYEYECKDCHFRFEKFQSMNAEPISVCPECGGHVKKLISTGAGIIFKGSGFYCTDYKKTKTTPEPKPKNNACKECCSSNKTDKCPKQDGN
ncbi:zinc ribbon domain-containing protein [bacterium]|nr:zinc ribbon domain-containing protein [bacterium]